MADCGKMLFRSAVYMIIYTSIIDIPFTGYCPAEHTPRISYAPFDQIFVSQVLARRCEYYKKRENIGRFFSE